MENIHLGFINVFKDGSFEFIWIRSWENGNFLAVLQENECRHAGDVKSQSQFLTFVNIDL